jgi:hypothetical protein
MQYKLRTSVARVVVVVMMVMTAARLKTFASFNSLISKIFIQDAQNTLPVLGYQILKYNPQCTIP